MNWQPIETAPKDGTVILLFDEACITPKIAVHVGFWGSDWKDDYDWLVSRYGEGIGMSSWIDEYEPACVEASHWMPLPEPPNSTPS